MKKNDTKNKVVKILIIAGVIIILWLLFIFPLIKFNENENTVLDAAKRYLEINKSMLPSEGSTRTIEVMTLLDQKYITDLRTAYNNNTCKAKNSFVKVKRVKGEYKYYVYLECGIFKSTVDHDGPVITINGKEKVTIEKDSSFKDPGVKSVVDNTDGTMDVKDVDTKGYVDTSVIGNYKIEYSIADSFDNKTIVTREVKVVENLSNTVKNSTDSDNVYKGNNVKNFIKFSGQLFRIVGLDSEGNIKIVSSENISFVDYNSIDEWLEKYYLEHINNNSKKYLVDYDFCSDKVSKDVVDTVSKCASAKNTKKAGLLAINEYNKSTKEGESYLYTDTINWTSSSLNSKKAWTTRSYFVDHDSKYMSYSRKYQFAVRPVLVLKKNTKVTSGDGSYSKPFEIGDFKKVKAGSSTTKTRSGEYVSYKNLIYRVIEPNEDGYTKVISNYNYVETVDTLKTPSIYNPEKVNTVAYYIANNVSKLYNTKIFVKHDIEVPIYKERPSYTGDKATKTYSVKFASPSLYEMYSSSYNANWYIESSKNSDIKTYSSDIGVVFNEGNDVAYSRMNTRFTGYLNKNAVIVSGEGTITNPYKLSY